MNESVLTRSQYLRRTVILCVSFARNLAYYRVGHSPARKSLLDLGNPDISFWRVMNGNFLDQVVLEWCKLFADRNGNHYCQNIVADQEEFKRDMLARLGVSEEAYNVYIKEMRSYRDKFVAHLDSDSVMQIPHLSLAKDAVWFYHEHIVLKEASEDFSRLPDTPEKLNRAYDHYTNEADGALSKVLDVYRARSH